MTSLQSLLTDYVKKVGPKVVFRNNNEEGVMGIGTFEFRAFKLKDVFYVNGLKSNLISINRLCDVSYKVFFYYHDGKVFDS